MPTRADNPLQARDILDLSNDYVSPSTETERAIAKIWSRAFNIDKVGIDDDFFDIGGDSLIATTIASAVSDALGVDFKPGLVMEFNTIRLMAQVGSVRPSRPMPSNVAATRSKGERPPLFVIHGRNGITFLRPGFLSGFHDDQPIYTFQVRGFDGQQEPFDRLEDIAADYLDAMLQLQPGPPWFIAAFCSGSWIAVEMARQMLRRGLGPNRIILLDPGLMHATLNDDYMMRRGFISGSDIPVLSVLARSLKMGGVNLLRRVKFLYKTGHFVTGLDRPSYELPAVEEYYIEQQRRRLGGNLGRRRDERAASDSAEIERIYTSDHAARASARLQLAYRMYRPDVLDFPVDMIVSQTLARRIEDPAHPISRALPKRRMVLSGETHEDTIEAGKPANACIIQALLDESPAVASQASAESRVA